MIALTVAFLVVAADPAVNAPLPPSPVLQEPITLTRGQLLQISIGRALIYVSSKPLEVRHAVYSEVNTDRKTGRLVWGVELKDGADVAVVKREMSNRLWLAAMAVAQTKVPLADSTKDGKVTDPKVEALVGSVDLAILVDGKVAARGNLDKAQIAWRE